MLSRIPITFTLVILALTVVNGDSSEKTTETGPKQQRSQLGKWEKWDLNKQLTEPVSIQYLWPWNTLFKALSAMEDDWFSNEPKVVSSKEKYEVHMNVRRFKPEELKIRVKHKYIIVEGKHEESSGNQRVNHFVQNLVLPAGSKAEEVTAVLKDGVLTVTVPRHELPPPPPEVEVPIQVITTEKPTTEAIEPNTEKTEKDEVTSTTEKKTEPSTSSAAPLAEQLELVEATTHAGKIRKKELKEPKPSKLEAAKGLDENGLDYALIDNE